MTLFRERAYYYCEHCGSYHFPDPNPQGIRVMGLDPDGLKCPQCAITLNLMVIDDFYQGFQCSNCRGLLFNRSSFRDVINVRRSSTKTPAEPISTYDPIELDRWTDCPVCQERMDTFQYLGPGNIVIDTCHSDDLIWLDYGELQKVINAPGRDRGVPRKKPTTEQEDQEKKPKKKPLENITLIDLIKILFDQSD
jgi:Zn-finger nucleic acid-binding protein